jgi:CheY-like chemotaxis protein
LLVVEDHDEGREFLRRLLTSEGHTVDAVQSCRDAHERLDSNGTSYDVMITDVGLPDCSGWELVAHARERLPSLRVGVITGWEPSAHSGDARGAAFVLRKPLRAAELLAHIAGRDTPASA